MRPVVLREAPGDVRLPGIDNVLSRLFASRGVDKFAEEAIGEGIAGVPLLHEYSARFQCEIEHRYPGGDHMILVARVLDVDFQEKPPLLYHGGSYGKKALD